MKLTILSDTHFTTATDYKSNLDLANALHNTDAVIHCGDFQSRQFYEYINSNYNLFCARGNTDYNLSQSVKPLQIITLKNYKIVITHGHLYNTKYLHLIFPDANIICYGHTHHPEISKNNNQQQLILNPGSFSSNRYVNFNSYCTLELTSNFKDLRPNIIKI